MPPSKPNRSALPSAQTDIPKILSKLLEAWTSLQECDSDVMAVALSPGRPASAKRIAAYEAFLGVKLPPSYRAFLALHDGYGGLTLDGSLLSIKDLMPGGRHHKAAEAWKKREGLPDAIVISRNPNQPDWIYLHPTNRAKQLELPVVVWTHDSDPERYKDFSSYLRAVQKEVVWNIQQASREKAALTPSRRPARASGPKHSDKTFATPRGAELESLAISPDGRRIAAMVSPNVVQVWDWQSQAVVVAIKCPDAQRGRGMCFSSSGTQLAVKGWTTLVYSIPAGSLLRELKPASSPGGAGLIFCKTGRYLFGGGPMKALTQWDLKTGKALELESTHSDVDQMALLKGGSLLAWSQAYGSSVHFWDVTTQPPRQARLVKVGEGLRRFAATEDGRLLACAVEAGVELWDLRSMRRMRAWPLQYVSSLSFSGDGERLAASGLETLKGKTRLAARVWDTGSSDVLWSLNAPRQRLELAFVPRSRELVRMDNELRASPVG